MPEKRTSNASHRGSRRSQSRYARLARVAVGIAISTPSGQTASGQTVDESRCLSVVVGTPKGGARLEQLDGARTGLARTPLPTGELRAKWQASLGSPAAQGPLVDVSGTTYVISDKGEVLALADDGSERWRVGTGGMSPGPPALLSDDTLAFVDGMGFAIAVRGGILRWRVRIGRASPAHPGGLPLDDGGVVLGTPYELAVLDAEGRQRARSVLKDDAAGPLLSAQGHLVYVGATGTVWSWSLAAGSDPTVLASFRSPVDRGAALVAGHTLWAVTAGGLSLSALDLESGRIVSRASANDSRWLGPPAVRSDAVIALLALPKGEVMSALDLSGDELDRIPLSRRPASASPLRPDLPDAGFAANASAPPHTAPLVDSLGTVAFADGRDLGTIERWGTHFSAHQGGSPPSVQLLLEACPAAPGASNRTTPPVIGLAPLSPYTLVAACRSGAVVAVRGNDGNTADAPRGQ